MSQYTIEQLVAGALFDFAGFLTTMEKPATFSGRHDAAVAVELLSEWAAKRGLNLDEARVKDWSATLRQQAARVDAYTFVQTVPDHCDRIVWRGNYYGLRDLCDPALEAALSAQPAPERQGVVGEYVANIDQYGGILWRSVPPPHGTKLYTHPAAPVGVPDGWNEAMWAAAIKASCEAESVYDESRPEGAWEKFGLRKNRIAHLFNAVLAAAPSAPQGTQQGDR